MYRFKIESLLFKNGTKIIPGGVNVIIGPNNCGKSKTLKEIKNFLLGIEDKNIILDDIGYSLPGDSEDFINSYCLDKKILEKTHDCQLKIYCNNAQETWSSNQSLDNYNNRQYSNISKDWRKQLDEMIKDFNVDSSKKNASESTNSNAILVSESFVEEEINGQKIRRLVSGSSTPLSVTHDDNYRIVNFFRQYGALFFNYLGTEEKLMIIKTQTRHGSDSFNTNFLSELYENDEILNELSYYVKKMFYKDILLDAFTLSNLAFRVGNDFSYVRNARKTDNSVNEHLMHEQFLDDEGDGLKSFTSTFLSLKLDDKDILLLDEPESFLHPPLARQMGEIIGASVHENKQLFISTHSTELLKGIMSTCNDVNVIRITRNENENMVSALDNNTLKKIVSTPLLRSSHVIEGLFCDKVVITESESDELLYQEVLSTIKPQSGIYFNHGQNKQTICLIASMYQKLNVDFSMVFDFDILRVKEEFNTLLGLTDIDKRTKQKYREICISLREYINGFGTNDDERKAYRDLYYHKYGIRKLPNLLKKDLKDMIDGLLSKKILILKTGALETTLENLGYPYIDNKKKWITEVLSTLSRIDKRLLERSRISKLLLTITK